MLKYKKGSKKRYRFEAEMSKEELQDIKQLIKQQGWTKREFIIKSQELINEEMSKTDILFDII